MCTVFKKCFLSSRLTRLFTKPIVHSILIPFLIQNLIRFSVKMTPFLKRLYVWETWDIFHASASLRTWGGLLNDLTCISQVKLSFRHLPSKYLERVQLINWRMAVMWDFLLLAKHCRRGTPFISIYFHFFLYISQFFCATLDVLENVLIFLTCFDSSTVLISLACISLFSW